MNDLIFIAIRPKIQTKSSHKIHRSELLRLDFVNLNSWIAIVVITLTHHQNSGFTELKVAVVYLSPHAAGERYEACKRDSHLMLYTKDMIRWGNLWKNSTN